MTNIDNPVDHRLNGRAERGPVDAMSTTVVHKQYRITGLQSHRLYRNQGGSTQ